MRMCCSRIAEKGLLSRICLSKNGLAWSTPSATTWARPNLRPRRVKTNPTLSRPLRRVSRTTLSRGSRGYVLLCVALWCILSSVLAHRFLYSSIHVVGQSMVPSLNEGDWRLINRWRHRLLGVERGDLVVLHEPRTRIPVVKRVIGLPGDVIHFRSGTVYVNYRQLAEPYLLPRVVTLSNQLGGEAVRLSANQFFLLGDNRPVSLDSRIYGPVARSDLVGIVTF
jgi:signal peptidase I